MTESQDLLQHPRRNLGNRYRSTARKFANLAKADPERARENMDWAEQNARQAILHDFTDERNWRFLAELKEMNEDSGGLQAVLEDVFVVLGRDPDNLDQLKGIDYLNVGRELLEAAFARDPLDPDAWWTQLSNSGVDSGIREFSERCRRLDFRDHAPTSCLDDVWSASEPQVMKRCSSISLAIYSRIDPSIMKCGWRWADFTNDVRRWTRRGRATTKFSNFGLT